MFRPVNDPASRDALCPVFLIEESITGAFAYTPNSVVRQVVSGSTRENDQPTMVKASFGIKPWRPSAGELRRLMTPGYVQGHMVSLRVVGRIVMLVLPPLMRPGQGSEDIVFGEATLPGITAFPIVLINHPDALSRPENYQLWRSRVEDIGNAFLMDLNDSGSMTPFPSLLRVEFAMGTYSMPGGIQEVVKMSPEGSFTRKFRLLTTHVVNYVIRSVPGASIVAIEPVWVVN